MEATETQNRKRKLDEVVSEHDAKPQSPTADQAEEPVKTSSGPNEATESQPPMSKNALKRIRKAEQMKIKRKFQKQQRKERKRKANEEAKKLQQEDPSAQAALDANHVSKKVKKRLLEAERVILPQRIVIDCSFDSLMTEKVLDNHFFSIPMAFFFFLIF